MPAVTVTTMLRLADDSTVPIVLREAHDGSDEWIVISIGGVLPEYWQAAMSCKLAGTRREPLDKLRERNFRRRHGIDAT